MLHDEDCASMCCIKKLAEQLNSHYKNSLKKQLLLRTKCTTKNILLRVPRISIVRTTKLLNVLDVQENMSEETNLLT